METLPQFRGKSGRIYHFAKMEVGNINIMNAFAGIVILAKERKAYIDVIYIGQFENIYHALVNTTLLNDAKIHHEADLIFVYPIGELAARTAHTYDLLAGWKPRMLGHRTLPQLYQGVSSIIPDQRRDVAPQH